MGVCRNMTQTLAYEIGAVFLTLACILWVSSARALFSRDFSSGAKALAIAALLALSAMAAYKILPTLRWDLPASRSTGTTEPTPPVAAPVRRPPPRPATVPRPFVGTISGLDPAPVATKESAEAEVSNIQATQPETPAVESATTETVNAPDRVSAPKQPGRPKRLLDSTRRILHLGHRKYEPAARATGHDQ
jgi:hypothetical protein